MQEFPVLRNKNLYLIFGVTLLAVMGVASITPAFPTIAEHFEIHYKKIGLLITVFTLPGIFLTPVLGVLADRFGRKQILVPALFLFAIAGFLCSQVQTYDSLLILRFIQGIGAASLGSLNITLIGDFFSPKQRPMAMGFNSSVLSIGTAVYPFLGGALALIAWNAPFYFPLLALPVGFLVIVMLDNPIVGKKDRFSDYLKQILKSLIHLEVLSLFLLNILTFVILYGSYLTYFPLVLKENFNSNSLMIGIIMSTSSLSTAVTSSMLGRLTQKYRQKDLLKVAYLFYIFSLLLVHFIKKNEIFMILPAVLFGIAQGINIPNIQTLLVGFAPMKYRAAFMSLNGTVLRLGQTLGPIIAGMFFAIGGISFAFIGGAIIAAVMILIVFLVI